MTTYASPVHAWNALGWVGTSAERVVGAMRWRVAAVVVPLAIMMTGLWLRAGAAPTVTCATVAAVGLAVTVWRRRYPQLIGVLVSSSGVCAAFCAALTVSITATGTVPAFAVTFPLSVITVTAAVFVAPHRGVHLGWSMGIAHAMTALGLPGLCFAASSSWAPAAQAASVFAALLTVYFRARKAERPQRSLLRRSLRGIAAAIVVSFGALTMAAAAPPPQAHALFGVGDFLESKTNDLICNFTRPDLTQEPIGTGPENLVPAHNLGQVKQMPTLGDSSTIPKHSDQAGNYDRLGDNYSLENYTLYEVAGLRGLKYVNWQKNDSGEEVCSIGPWMSVTTGNLVMKLNLYILQAAISFKEMAQTEKPFQFLYDKTIPFVSSMFTYFFMPMSGLMLTLTAIAMMVGALGRGGFRSALGNAGGTLAVLVLGGLLFGGMSGASWANPNTNGWFIIASSFEKMTNMTNSAMSEIIFSTFTWESSDMMCKKPVPVPPVPGQTPGFDAAVPGQRYSSCVLAEALAYRPWALGQFGAAGNKVISTGTNVTRFGNPSAGAPTDLVKSKDDMKGQGLPCYNNVDGCKDLRSYLIAQEGGPSFTASREKCMNDKNDYAHLVQCDPYHAVAYELNQQAKSDKTAISNRANEIRRSYVGQGSFPHLTQAMVAMFGTFVTGIGIGMISLICLYWQLILYVLFLLGPFRLTVAAFPGRARDGIVYAADFFATFVMRFAYGVLTSIVIVLVLAIFTGTMSMGMKIVLLIILLFGMFKAVRKVQETAKVKGSSVNGPAHSVTGVAGAAAGIAGYLAVTKGAPAAAKAGWKGTKATAGGARTAMIGRPPNRPAASPPGASGPSPSQGIGGSGAATGVPGSRPTVRGRPIGGAVGAGIGVGQRTMPHLRSGATSVARSASAFARPVTSAAGNRARDAALRASQGGRIAGHAANKRLGAALSSHAVTRLNGGVSTASDYAKAAANRVGTEARGVMSWATPRYLAEGWDEDKRSTMDAKVSSSKVAWWLDGGVAAVGGSAGGSGRSTFTKVGQDRLRRQYAADIGRARRKTAFDNRFRR